MAKFNVGDKARALITDPFCGDFEKGNVFDVVEVHDTNIVFYDNAGDERLRPEEEFEKVEPQSVVYVTRNGTAYLPDDYATVSNLMTPFFLTEFAKNVAEEMEEAKEAKAEPEPNHYVEIAIRFTRNEDGVVENYSQSLVMDKAENLDEVLKGMTKALQASGFNYVDGLNWY